MSNFTKSILYSTTVLAVGLIAIFAIYDVVSMQKQGGQAVTAIEPAAGDGTSQIGIDANAMSESLNDIRTSAGDTLEEAQEEVAEMKEALESIENQDIQKTEKPIIDTDIEATDKDIAENAAEESDVVEVDAESAEPAAGKIEEEIVETGESVIEKAEEIENAIPTPKEEY